MVRAVARDPLVARILRRYFNAVASQLWADALRENNLLRGVARRSLAS